MPEIQIGAPHAMLLRPGKAMLAENESPDGEVTSQGTQERESVHPSCIENHKLLELGCGRGLCKL